MQPKITHNIFSFICLLVVVFFTLTFPNTASCSEWTLFKRASIKSKNHGSLQIEHREGKGIYIFFYMHNKEVSFKNNLPLYQVDDGKVHHLDKMPKLTTGKNRWVRWRFTDDIKKISPELKEIINGKKLYFQYHLPDNTIKEAVFELQGAKDAVNEIVR